MSARSELRKDLSAIDRETIEKVWSDAARRMAAASRKTSGKSLGQLAAGPRPRVGPRGGRGRSRWSAQNTSDSFHASAKKVVGQVRASNRPARAVGINRAKRKSAGLPLPSRVRKSIPDAVHLTDEEIVKVWSDAARAASAAARRNGMSLGQRAAKGPRNLRRKKGQRQSTFEGRKATEAKEHGEAVAAATADRAASRPHRQAGIAAAKGKSASNKARAADAAGDKGPGQRPAPAKHWSTLGRSSGAPQRKPMAPADAGRNQRIDGRGHVWEMRQEHAAAKANPQEKWRQDVERMGARNQPAPKADAAAARRKAAEARWNTDLSPHDSRPSKQKKDELAAWRVKPKVRRV